MIIPNLLVSDMARAVAFYTEVIGMKLVILLGPDNTMFQDSSRADDAVFATLELEGHQLMLQTQEHLQQALGLDLSATHNGLSATVYFRDIDPDPIVERIDPSQLISGPELRWYGMREVCLRDPDGHVIVIGIAEGAAPA